MNKKPIIFTKNQKLLTFFVFFILLTIISTEVGFFANIYALIYQRFGLTESFGNIIVGWIIFGNYLVIGISTLFFGFFADKFDRMKVLVIGVMAWSILSFFCFLAQDIATFMILRILIGVGQGALMPIGFSLLMDLIKFNSRGFISSCKLLSGNPNHPFSFFNQTRSCCEKIYSSALSYKTFSDKIKESFSIR